MNNISNLDHESYDLVYQPSPCSLDQSDQSATGTPGYSTISGDSFVHFRTNSDTSAFSESLDDQSYSSEPSPSFWPGSRSGGNRQNQAVLTRLTMKHNKSNLSDKLDDHDHDHHDQEALDAELELIKERFAKLLLGEDMSGGGKGVCTAVTISNSITNLYATVFGQNLRLEPLNPEKRALWKREMECLLSVCDYIVEFFPVTHHNSQDGTSMEVMSSRPRADIFINLPALRKLDTMLIEILDSFDETEFWYAEQGSVSSGSMSSGGGGGPSGSFRRIAQRKDEKWWLPVPCVPPKGLSENERKHLRHNRDCANQIHKAAMAINSTVLAEMEIPDSYMANLPKSGKACLGDSMYRYMCTAEKFSPEHLLENLNVASEHEALELADRVESSMYTWRRKACLSHAKSSWGVVKDLMSDTDRTDKNHVLAERAETLLFCLKQKFPELSQTSLDTCKIQYNKDVGQAILESYSRVLEGFAFNLVAWVEDVLFVDRAARNRDH